MLLGSGCRGVGGGGAGGLAACGALYAVQQGSVVVTCGLWIA